MLRVLGLLAIAAAAAQITAANESSTALAEQQMSARSIAFTQNSGQWDEQVLFRADAGGATMWFCKDRVVNQFTRRVGSSANAAMCHSRENGNPYLRMTDPLDRFNNEPDSVDQLVITARFVDANPNVEVVAEGMMEYKCNYFIGNDPTKWHTDVANYESVALHGIYSGVDLTFSGSADGRLSYQYSVSPGVDAEQVKLEYEGIDEMSANEFGILTARTEWGEIAGLIAASLDSAGLGLAEFSSPSASAVTSHGEGSPSEQRGPHAVELVYSTFLGGSNTDAGYGIAVDGSGAAYVTGGTLSSNFPTFNPYQGTHKAGDYDVFVTKLSSSGNSLVYSTYLAGKGTDTGYGIAVDGSGAVYVTGVTRSGDFPTFNPYQTLQWGSDAFVTKLSLTGDSLVYSTYLGGSSNDGGHGIAVDGSGAAYVTGYTLSADFPTLNPYQTLQGGRDVFVTKLSSSGDSLVYSTYLGGSAYGSGYDEGNGIAVDGSGAVYVTGYTQSPNFPTLNPYQTDQTGHDAFVTKLSSSGSSPVYSTYIGGNSYDEGFGIAVDGFGAAYVAGHTQSTDFPTLNPYQTYQGNWDVFVTKLSGSGQSLIYSTYLGGNDWDDGFGIAVDGSGAAYVTGETNSADFPTLNPYQTDQWSYDAFVTRLSSSGNNLVYSTYLAGGDVERCRGIALVSCPRDIFTKSFDLLQD
jgi:hypothetical protein